MSERKITENTLIPISLVIVLIGGVAWLTTLKVDANSLKEQVASIEKKQDAYNEVIQEMNLRLSRIEWGVASLKKDRR